MLYSQGHICIFNFHTKNTFGMKLHEHPEFYNPNHKFHNEEWARIPDMDAEYYISSIGRVRSFTRRANGRILKLRVSRLGYSRYSLLRDGTSRHASGHRMVALAFIPNPEGKPCVNHINNDPLDNRAENLEWCTHKENMAHSARQGRRPDFRGIKNPSSKLSPEQVMEIRATYSRGLGQVLGDRYGVSKTLIQKIARRELWKNI